MKTRLRYTNVNGILTLKNLVSTTHNEVLSVLLNPETLTAVITNSKEEHLLTVTGTSLQTIKIDVKKALLDLGVIFLNEVRAKKVSLAA